MLDKYDIFTLIDKEYITMAKADLFDKTYYFIVEVDEEENPLNNFKIVYDFEDGLLEEEDINVLNKVKEVLLNQIEEDSKKQ